jgi:hypothetical protein
MICGAFNLLDLLGLLDIEIFYQGPQGSDGTFAEFSDFDNTGLPGQVYEPLNFNGDPGPDQSIFAEKGAQRRSFGLVTAVQWRQRGQGAWFKVTVCQKRISPGAVNRVVIRKQSGILS